MKKASWIESIGLAAVVAGLVFVGLEIRQNNQLAQAAAYQEIGFTSAQAWRGYSQDPEFNLLHLRHFNQDSTWWAEQDSLDVGLLAANMIASLREYETLFLQVELGLLDPVAMEKFGWGEFRNMGALQYLWPWVGHFADPAFRGYITEDWSEVPPLATRGSCAPLPALCRSIEP